MDDPARKVAVVHVEALRNPHRYSRAQRETVYQVAYHLSVMYGPQRFVLTTEPDEIPEDDDAHGR